MGHHHPELVPLELLPLDPGRDHADPPRPAGREIIERELPQPVQGLLRRLARWALWFEAGHGPDQFGTEFTVRRRIDADLDHTVPAVLAAARDLQARAAPAPSARRRPPRLELQLDAVHRDGGVVRIPARLRSPWLPVPVPVELDVERWSRRQCELRLESRRRHGHAHPSSRYFDAAHDALDALRAAAEAAIDAHPGS